MSIASGQGLTCSTIEPFCAGNSTLIFPNSNPGTPGASDSAEPGIDPLPRRSPAVSPGVSAPLPLTRELPRGVDRRCVPETDS